jgi:hypothetical protein
MRTKKKNPEEDIQKMPRFKLATINTRTTFILVEPLLEKTSKSLLTVATVIFGGSLTFLGLRNGYEHTTYLRLSWLMLAISVVIHLFVQIAMLDSLIAHGRTETDVDRANESLKEGNLLDTISGFFRSAFTSHYNQQLFFRSVRYTQFFLLLQFITVLLGGCFIGIFVWLNL